MIDPNILLQGRGADVETPLQAQAQVLGVQNLRNVGQIQQGQIAMQPGELEAQGQENQTRALALKQQQDVNAAYLAAYTPGTNGTPGALDNSKLQGALIQGGHGSAVAGILGAQAEFNKKVADASKAQSEAATAHADLLGAGGRAAQQSNYDPNLFLLHTTQALGEHAIDPATAQPVLTAVQQALQQDPSGASARAIIKQNADSWVEASGAQQKLLNEGKTAQGSADRGTAALQTSDREKAQSDLTAAAARLGNVKSQGEYASILDSLPHGIAVKFPAAESWDASSTPGAALRVGLTPEQQVAADNRAAELAKLNTPAELAYKAAKGDKDASRALEILQASNIAERKASGQNVSVNLTPAGQAVYDRNLQTTGTPIAIPRGPGGAVVVGSLNRIGAATPDVNLGATKADYAADKGSLVKMQGQSDALDAYGTKFIGNLDQFTKIARSVPNLPAPILNMPLRQLDEKVLGSYGLGKDIYGRLNVARTIAANEGGRILSGGGNLGGVVSDNARHEISSLLDPNATLANWLSAADQLHIDYGITKKAMRDQISTIKGRISHHEASATPTKSLDDIFGTKK